MTTLDDALDVEWVDGPPPGGRGRPVPLLTELLGDLMEHPKRWAIIDRRAKPASAANTWRNRAKAPKNAEHLWEFAGREGAVYARYLGPAK